MFKVTKPDEMNETFAKAFNTRSLDSLVALYEENAVLRPNPTEEQRVGVDEIRPELEKLLQMPGTLVSRNNFCIEQDGIALLRADWSFIGGDGSQIASGSSTEVVRRQPDGSWRYIIDHAFGASLPRIF